MNIAARLDYEQDHEYLRLKIALDNRKELLNRSYKASLSNVGTGFEGLIVGDELIPIVPVKSGGGQTVKITFPK